MAYELNHCYHVVSAASRLRLNRYGNGAISAHQNITLWIPTEDWDQVWKLQAERDGASLRSALNLSYGLNVWQGSDNMNNCDVYPVSGNEQDATLDLLTVNSAQNMYRIKLIHHELYLTATGIQNGSDVRWEPYTGMDSQLWKLEPTMCPEPPEPVESVDQERLKELCLEYTDFYMENEKIQLPYRWAGKLTPSKIRENLTVLAQKNPGQSLQALAAAHPVECGVDCSGLVYFCLNEAAGGKVRTYFEDKLGLPGVLSYAYGISAANMTNSAYGTVLNRAQDVRPGDVIRFDDGGHIGVIYEVETADGIVEKIYYAHSSGDKGPHRGVITVVVPEANLNDPRQSWEDWDAFYAPVIKSLYNYTLRYTI